MRKILNRDMLTVIMLFLLVILVGMGYIDRGHPWGDDFAAYMLEARAIANGTMEEQSCINRIIHPSELSFGGQEIPDQVTYVWGYPLALSIIYRAVGYDPFSGGMPIVYKLPNLIAYALFAAIIYLFYRRRFSFEVSLFMALLFALHADMLIYVNEMLSDVFCLMLSMAALLLVEVFLECDSKRKKTCIGVLLGVVLWYNYEVRLNGVTVIYIVLFAHALHLLRSRSSRREWAVQLTPYISLLLLFTVSICVMPQATSNTMHIASGPNSWIAYNLYYYKGLIRDWIQMMIPEYMPLRDYAHYIAYGMIVIGILYAGVMRNLHLTVLMFGTFAVVLLLPYAQPLRYLFNALPLVLLFAAYGVQFFWKRIKEYLGSGVTHVMRYLGYTVMLACVLNMTAFVRMEIQEHERMGGIEYRYGAYSDDALDVYKYIRDNTEGDALIASMKPRATMLNTDRLCYSPGINENRFVDMDYLLAFHVKDIKGFYDHVTEGVWPELWTEMEEVYRNDSFVVYKRTKNGESFEEMS